MTKKNPEKFSSDDNGDVQIITKKETQVKKPKMYRVIILNDDYTPMDFVVWLLQVVFHKSEEIATKLMWDVHKKGKGICGLYPFDVARTKVYQAKQLAEKHQHPLECDMEEA